MKTVKRTFKKKFKRSFNALLLLITFAVAPCPASDLVATEEGAAFLRQRSESIGNSLYLYTVHNAERLIAERLAQQGLEDNGNMERVEFYTVVSNDRHESDSEEGRRMRRRRMKKEERRKNSMRSKLAKKKRKSEINNETDNEVNNNVNEIKFQIAEYEDPAESNIEKEKRAEEKEEESSIRYKPAKMKEKRKGKAAVSDNYCDMDFKEMNFKEEEMDFEEKEMDFEEEEIEIKNVARSFAVNVMNILRGHGGKERIREALEELFSIVNPPEDPNMLINEELKNIFVRILLHQTISFIRESFIKGKPENFKTCMIMIFRYLMENGENGRLNLRSAANNAFCRRIAISPASFCSLSDAFLLHPLLATPHPLLLPPPPNLIAPFMYRFMSSSSSSSSPSSSAPPPLFLDKNEGDFLPSSSSSPGSSTPPPLFHDKNEGDFLPLSSPPPLSFAKIKSALRIPDAPDSFSYLPPSYLLPSDSLPLSARIDIERSVYELLFSESKTKFASNLDELDSKSSKYTEENLGSFLETLFDAVIKALSGDVIKKLIEHLKDKEDSYRELQEQPADHGGESDLDPSLRRLIYEFARDEVIEELVQSTSSSSVNEKET
jgi:hypothetical protein